ncbi:hypothetical protein [Nocardioides sp. GY 10127]|uniref:hypothetical protein n=1 Tax=Nocardioides sp. GY 10127 TaxID=2569762 RepID=UPI0010A753A2|nr:hypothetical protein [Nocardioides sp. GY 10127]TIC81906.1 hypothetical protein E8D37_12115 [Nocardioides sp. GY 10127]
MKDLPPAQAGRRAPRAAGVVTAGAVAAGLLTAGSGPLPADANDTPGIHLSRTYGAPGDEVRVSGGVPGSDKGTTALQALRRGRWVTLVRGRHHGSYALRAPLRDGVQTWRVLVDGQSTPTVRLRGVTPGPYDPPPGPVFTAVAPAASGTDLPTLSTDGRWVAVRGARVPLLRDRLTGRAEKPWAQDARPALSPDGRLVTLVRRGRGVLLDLWTFATTPLPRPAGRRVAAAAPADDGSLALVLVDGDGLRAPFVLRPGDESPEQLAPATDGTVQAVLASGSDTVALTTSAALTADDVDEAEDAYLLLDGSPELLDETADARTHSPTLSADGRRVAWLAESPGGTEVVVRDVGTGAELFRHPADEAVLSGDGTHVAWRDGDVLASSDLDAPTTRSVAVPDARELAVSGDGRWVAFTATASPIDGGATPSATWLWDRDAD